VVPFLTETPPKSFVLGATGHVGRATVRELLREVRPGAQVTAHIRPDSPDLKTWEARFREWGAEVVVCPWTATELGKAMTTAAPTHVFFLHGTRTAGAESADNQGGATPPVDLSLAQVGIEAASALEPRPRLVYLSIRGASPDSRGYVQRTRWQVENMVTSSGIPWTICRAPRLEGSGLGSQPWSVALAAMLERVAALGLRLVGAAQTAARLRPIQAEELAYGLVHSAFNYTTIGRVLEAEELRYRTAIHRAGWIPATRREDPRH
tara:strand:+ start:7694 stop:8488 length:795 start_codon:yes stop_codon:yes gene_type:complete